MKILKKKANKKKKKIALVVSLAVVSLTDRTDSWKLQPLDLELQSFYLFYLTRIISLFTRRGQENMKPRALAMLCSSSSSLPFFLLILYFFLPSAPFLPHLCMALFTVLEITSPPQSPRREHPLSVCYCCTLLASSLSWVFICFPLDGAVGVGGAGRAGTGAAGLYSLFC